jgi:hypothetical protein
MDKLAICGHPLFPDTLIFLKISLEFIGYNKGCNEDISIYLRWAGGISGSFLPLHLKP